MQRFSVLLTALISFVITAAASPTPGDISNGFERSQIDANFQRDLPEKRKELETGIETNYDDV
ncbi:hypothetical protein CY34DRAFT_808379, partial [Suillus luteus UH-Slu-Lm8-n1]